MKLKSILPMFAALTGLALLPAASNATTPIQETYGTAYTNDFVGTIMVFGQGSSCTCYGLNFAGLSNGNVWRLAGAKVLSISNYEDVNQVLHSHLQVITYFTGAGYTQEASLTTIDITDPASGPETVSLNIVDYKNPSVVLYSGDDQVTQAGFSVIVNPALAAAAK
jgi:hypothetical protein